MGKYNVAIQVLFTNGKEISENTKSTDSREEAEQARVVIQNQFAEIFSAGAVGGYFIVGDHVFNTRRIDSIAASVQSVRVDLG